MAQNNCITCGDFHNLRICPSCGSTDYICDEKFEDEESDGDHVITNHDIEEIISDLD